jgi:uncharacterized protein (TIGR03067 family)
MIKATMLGFTVSAVLLVGGGTDEATLKKERAHLQGTWKILKLITPKGEDEAWRDGLFIIGEDDSAELRKGGETKKATVKINPAAKPKEIDITPGDDTNKLMRGIYKIEKDTLTICIAHRPTSDRPTEFKAPEDGQAVLVTLEKSK